MKTALAIAWIFYGLGGSATSTGVDQIAATLRHTPGIEVRGPYLYDNWRSVAANIKKAPRNAKKVVIGYSCGVGATAWAAAKSGVPIDKIVGIQGSVYCPPSPLGSNVRAAFEVFNPYCIETVGLGCAKYTAGPAFKGYIHIVPREVSHGAADLDQLTQREVIHEVEEVLPVDHCPHVAPNKIECD